MYTLYGTQGSGSAAIEVALVRCRTPYRIVRASSWEADSAQDELARLNPLRQIPTLQLPDGSAMTESAAILLHLAEAFPDARLMPTDAAGRAQSIRGLVFIAANCYAAVSVADYPERWCTDADEPTRERVRQAARAQLHRSWAIFADSFVAAPYYAGAAPGALDLLAAVVSKWSGTRAFVRKERPAFLQTIEAIEAHADVAPVFARHWPAS
jgi:GST-like protein